MIRFDSLILESPRYITFGCLLRGRARQGFLQSGKFRQPLRLVVKTGFRHLEKTQRVLVVGELKMGARELEMKGGVGNHAQGFFQIVDRLSRLPLLEQRPASFC